MDKLICICPMRADGKLKTVRPSQGTSYLNVAESPCRLRGYCAPVQPHLDRPRGRECVKRLSERRNGNAQVPWRTRPAKGRGRRMWSERRLDRSTGKWRTPVPG